MQGNHLGFILMSLLELSIPAIPFHPVNVSTADAGMEPMTD